MPRIMGYWARLLLSILMFGGGLGSYVNAQDTSQSKFRDGVKSEILGPLFDGSGYIVEMAKLERVEGYDPGDFQYISDDDRQKAQTLELAAFRVSFKISLTDQYFAAAKQVFSSAGKAISTAPPMLMNPQDIVIFRIPVAPSAGETNPTIYNKELIVELGQYTKIIWKALQQELTPNSKGYLKVSLKGAQGTALREVVFKIEDGQWPMQLGGRAMPGTVEDDLKLHSNVTTSHIQVLSETDGSGKSVETWMPIQGNTSCVNGFDVTGFRKNSRLLSVILLTDAETAKQVQDASVNFQLISMSSWRADLLKKQAAQQEQAEVTATPLKRDVALSDQAMVAESPVAKTPREANTTTQRPVDREARPTATVSAGNSNQLGDWIVWFVIGSFFILTIVGLGLGLMDVAVFYRDSHDVAISVGGLAIMVASLYLAPFIGRGFAWVGIGMAAIVVVLSIRGTFRDNPSFLMAIPVAIAKLLVSFLYVIHWAGVLMPAGKTARKRNSNRVESAVWVAALSALIYRLTNGSRVAAKRNQGTPPVD